MSPQYGELRPTSGWDLFGSLGHPSKFQRVSRLGFVTAATSLTWNQQNFTWSFAVSWAGTLYVHFWGLLPLTEFCQLQLNIHVVTKSCVLLYWQRYCTALEYRPSAKPCGVAQGMELRNFRRGSHLYSAGRPSHWASAHILVTFALGNSGYNVIASPNINTEIYWAYSISYTNCWVAKIRQHGQIQSADQKSCYRAI